MFKYLPATFLYTSRVTASECADIDREYMPYVLANSHKQSEDASNVRTDYFDQSVEPWGLFVNILFQHFSSFARECLVSSGTYLASFDTWFNYYASGSAMIHHSHPEADFGVVYCLRNAGQKKTLFNTFSHEYVTMEDRYSKLESCSFDWDPTPGDYVFFPSSLFHATQATELDGERITLIANIVMKKKGDSDELSISLREKEPK